jgi:hypothetical protein
MRLAAVFGALVEQSKAKHVVEFQGRIHVSFLRHSAFCFVIRVELDQ